MKRYTHRITKKERAAIDILYNPRTTLTPRQQPLMQTRSTHDADLDNYRRYLQRILLTSERDVMQELRRVIDFAEMSEQEFATATWTAITNAIQSYDLAKPERLRPTQPERKETDHRGISQST